MNNSIDPISMTLWIVSLVLSMFFSGMEIAFISSDKLRYALKKKNKNVIDYILNVFYSHPRKFLSTLTVGNLFVLIIFVYSTVFLFKVQNGQLPLTESTPIEIFLQFLIASVIILITGELLPRAIFRVNANMWVKVLSIPAFFFYVLLYPVSKAFTTTGSFILRLTGVKFNPAEERALGRIELDSFVKQGIGETPDVNILDSEVKIFRNALDFSSVKLRDCMVPRTDIIAISKDTSIDELKDTFVETGYSKILVYEDDIDNIIGYIHMWEMFINPVNWTYEIAPISFYPESMLARNLMSELLLQRRSIAVVVDEFGGAAGIITMEDLVEEIFGDIEDEYDVQTHVAKKISDNEYILSGRLEITQLNEMFDLHLPQEDDYTTIAGLILHYIQRFPKTYETIEIDRFTFKILKVTSRKIEITKLIVNGSS